jgi:hypothetical protein
LLSSRASARRRRKSPPRRAASCSSPSTRRAPTGAAFLDELAAHGVRYAMARCAAPITLPSHATILSGVLPCTHGVRDNGLFVLDGAATLLSEVVKERGFSTGAFVGSFILDGRYGLAQGFDVYHGPPPSRLGLQREVIERPASAVVDDALGWLEKLDRGASLFLWVHFYDPHAPHSGSYDDEIASCDAQLARLRKRLDELGFGEGLLEVVTADHGEGLGDHGEETHGVLLHDATMRVPLLLRGGGLPSGLVVATPVTHVQIAPTVLDWLGISTEIDARTGFSEYRRRVDVPSNFDPFRDYDVTFPRMDLADALVALHARVVGPLRLFVGGRIPIAGLHECDCQASKREVRRQFPKRSQRKHSWSSAAHRLAGSGGWIMAQVEVLPVRALMRFYRRRQSCAANL